jgi:hypothetical protein
MVLIDAFGQILIGLRLDLDLDQNPFGLPVQSPYLDEFVDALLAQIGVPHHFLQFRVQELGRDAPVDIPGGFRKTQLGERLQIKFDGFFPGAIVVECFVHAWLPSLQVGLQSKRWYFRPKWGLEVRKTPENALGNDGFPRHVETRRSPIWKKMVRHEMLQ